MRIRFSSEKGICVTVINRRILFVVKYGSYGHRIYTMRLY